MILCNIIAVMDHMMANYYAIISHSTCVHRTAKYVT